MAKNDHFRTVKRMLWVDQTIKELDCINMFIFTEIETDDLNTDSINHIVKDIPFTDYMVKLTHTDNTWLK